jgi:hypothetical protein
LQKIRSGKKPYDKENLKRAFQASLSGMSVYRASRLYEVPESTLRDRTRHNVTLDCRSGPVRLFNDEEEKLLVDHIIHMANIGYGYTISSIQYMAADYARSLGKSVKAREGLSQNWFYAFLGRWEQLKVVAPQKLGMARAKAASKENIGNYFQELEKVLIENNLLNAPERIFNVDESGLSTEHSPPKIVCDKDTVAQAITSPRTKNITIIGAANAVGNHVPPFYIFSGKRWSDDLLDGALPGSSGGMSDSGWINRGLFERYLSEHFSKHVKLDKTGPPTLILYDGHKSHLSLTLTEWAKENNVVLFVLPPHSSHLTQPLDVGVFGPLKKYYSHECHSYMHSNPGVSVTRYEVARLTSRPYAKSFSPDNIISAFRKSGIYPFDKNIITEHQTAPSTIYLDEERGDADVAPLAEQVETETSNKEPTTTAKSFLENRTITHIVQRPKKKFTPPLKVIGNLMSEKNTDILKSLQVKKPSNNSKAVDRTNIVASLITVSNQTSQITSPKPSTATCHDASPAHNISSPDDSIYDDLCCACRQSLPPQLVNFPDVKLIKWGQCDVCKHWVHLAHCTPVKVLRRGSTFRCIHCPEE